MKKVFIILSVLAAAMATGAWAQSHAADQNQALFLPKFFAPAFEVDGKRLHLKTKHEKNEEQRSDYVTEDQSVALSIVNAECRRTDCMSRFHAALWALNAEMKDTGGDFRDFSLRDAHAESRRGNTRTYFFAFWLPSSIQIWAYAVSEDHAQGVAKKYGLLRSLVNRQRYHLAKAAGNVTLGAWSAEALEHAHDLLLQGKKSEALAVMQEVVTTSPNNLDAHLDLSRNTEDGARAKESARIVFENAENRELLDKAAKILGKPRPKFEDLPLLRKNETGLQLILIPLPPVNLWLLKDVAEAYSKMTGVTVKIRRLQEAWTLSAPDRISHQRVVQKALKTLTGRNLDFTGWGKTRYLEELERAVDTKSPLERYRARELIEKVDQDPGQYLANPYLAALIRIIGRYRSTDRRTMYVGITSANIYAGNNNYLFSYGTPFEGASILSYAVLRARGSAEPQSRRRLVERTAKELVPASLKQLGIRRSTDPRDPYSYANSVRRVDQKTLILSRSVKEALGNLHNNP
jgi:predicted Zn-dependent protease